MDTSKPITRTTSPRNDAAARRMAAALAGMGVLHMVRPDLFDDVIPPALPGSARAWTLGSGVAELAVAGLLAVPRTRRAGGRAAQGLFLGVWPGNAWMAWRWRRRPWPAQLVSLGRLPLQIPMIQAAGRIARGTVGDPELVNGSGGETPNSDTTTSGVSRTAGPWCGRA